MTTPLLPTPFSIPDLLPPSTFPYHPPVPDPQEHSDSSLDVLWKEYARVFQDLDDLTLARWCSQTLGQLAGKGWRMSHPLVGSLRLATQIANERGVWQQRLINMPVGYRPSPCCGSPILPYLTRDVLDHGLMCVHCHESAVPFDQLPEALITPLRNWANRYAQAHEVAHWEDRRRNRSDYDDLFEKAAQQAELLLAESVNDLVPRLIEHFPILIWEDQDECLEVRPEDIPV